MDDVSFTFSSDPSDQKRVCKLALELMNFTLTISLADGSIFTISEQEEVQRVLDEIQAMDLKNETKDRGDGNRLSIEVNLDPLNAVKTYHCRLS
jgi:hypothetical protein